MKDKGNVRQAAADLLLDRGMRFNFTDAPFFLRALRLHRVHIRRLKGGTILELSRTILKYDLESVQTAADANAKMEGVAEVLAIAILNKKMLIRFFRKPLTKILLWNVDAITLVQIYLIVSSINKVADFMIITGYFVRQMQTMMNPKLPGQTVTGS